MKLLGDGAMLHFPDPGEGVLCGLELVDRVEKAALPPARVGIAAARSCSARVTATAGS